MLAAIIVDGKVFNLVETDTLINDTWTLVEAAPDTRIGDLFDGVNFSHPPVPAPTREELKAERELAVANIKVTTQAGNTFDGDEISQTRMARAIIGLQATGTPSLTWVLADNTVIQATAAELTEAMALAGAAQAAIWVIE